jgi:hypothetical protein
MGVAELVAKVKAGFFPPACSKTPNEWGTELVAVKGTQASFLWV